MGEADYKEFNYASITNHNLTAIPTSSGLNYSSNYDLVVCPELTYFFNNSCYFDPISQFVGAVYPV